MPSSFPYVVKAAFDDVVESFEDALTYGNLATKIDLGDAQEQVFSRDKVWIPQPMIGSSYDGFDQTSNFDGLTQLWVPAQVGFHKSSPKSLSAKAMRNKMAIDMYAGEVKTKLASDVNKAIRNRVALEGSIFTKRTVAPTGSADLFLSSAQMTEVGVPAGERVAMIGIRNAIGMLSNVSDRAYMGDLSKQAYQDAKLSARIAGFNVYEDDQPIRLAPAAGGATTVNGANQYWEPAATTIQTDGTENNRDNRYSQLVVTAAAIGSVKAGDAFTITGVNSVHMISKQDTGQLQTFRVISVNTSTNTLTVAPAIISNGGNTIGGREYQNVSATPANGAAITWLNTTLAEVSPFFLKSAVGLLPGTFEVEPEDGWEVMQATTPKLGLRIICTKQGAINDLSTKMRWDIDFGTVLTQPQFAGAMMFNQA
jgi:hypothetical protein